MIEFGIWAPTEDDFWASWQAAGIVDENRAFLPEYSNGIQLSNSWGGKITKTPAVRDPDTGEIITPAVEVPGWHCNARVYGPLEQEMTYGLPQRDENGNELGIWERTWAAEVFQLEFHDEDPVTKVPAGWSSAAYGVKYFDLRSVATPANTWA